MMNQTISGLVVLIGASPEDCEWWAQTNRRDPNLVKTLDSVPIGVAFASDQIIVLPGWQPHPDEVIWWRDTILQRLLHGLADEEFLTRFSEQVPGLIPEGWLRV